MELSHAFPAQAAGRAQLFAHYVSKQFAAAAARELRVDAGGATAALCRVEAEADGDRDATLRAVAPACCAGFAFNASFPKLDGRSTLAVAAADADRLACRRRAFPLRDAPPVSLPFAVAHAGEGGGGDDDGDDLDGDGSVAALADDLARLSPGLVGADIRSVVNEAALSAMADGRYRATRQDLLRALEDALLGKPLVDDDDREKDDDDRTKDAPDREPAPPRRRPDWRVAVHEAGHAVASFKLEHVDDAIRASVRPRAAGSLGVTVLGAPSDATLFSEAQLRDRLVLLLAGRAAEAHVFDGDSSSGPSDDLAKAADLAKHIVADLGMSGLGAAAAVGDVDDAVRAELKRAEDRANDLVKAHDALLRAVADALLEHETLDGPGLRAILAPPPPPPDRRADRPRPARATAAA